MKPVHLSAILTTVALALAFIGAGSRPAAADQPVIIFQFPVEGDVLKEPPLVFQMCFKDPVDVRDLPSTGGEGDFNFEIHPPGQFGLGARIVFQPDGYGVAIYPGNPIGTYVEGEWTWDYRVRDRETLEPIEGTVTFRTDAQTGRDVLQPTPPACLAGGATNVPSDQTPTETPISVDEGDDSDTPIGLLIAIVAGAVIAAAGVAGYLWSRRRRTTGGSPDDAGGGAS